MEHVDLYLIHWPRPSQDLYVEAWQALIEAQQAGLTRAIGVSNFQPAHLRADHRGDRRHAGGQPDRAAPAADPARPAPRARRPRHRHRGLEPAGAGQGADRAGGQEIAEAHDRTPGQVVLRWHIQLGNVVFPKSVEPSSGSQQNIDIFDFELSEEEMERIEALDRGERTGPDPDAFAF